jgi:hypothetical protein
MQAKSFVRRVQQTAAQLQLMADHAAAEQASDTWVNARSNAEYAEWAGWANAQRATVCPQCGSDERWTEEGPCC